MDKDERTEQNLVVIVQKALTTSKYLFMRTVEISVENGKLRVAGTVGSHYQKQLTQEFVMALVGKGRADFSGLTVGKLE